MQSMTFGLSRRLFLTSSAALLATGRAFAADKIKPDAKSALIVTDVQNCFVDGGTLPVKGGTEIVPVINKLAPAFANIVITQDWHTPGHISFASAHPGKVNTGMRFHLASVRVGKAVVAQQIGQQALG